MVEETEVADLTVPLESIPSQRPWASWALTGALVVEIIGAMVIIVRSPKAFAAIPLVGSILSDTDKVWIFSIWLGCALAATVALLIDRRRVRVPGNRRRHVLATVGATGALAVLALVLTWNDPQYPSLPSWVGFGFTPILIGAAAAAPLLAFTLRPRRWQRFLFPSSIAVTIALGLPPLIRAPWSFGRSFNNQFTFDELLAPANGRLPGFDEITQYENLLGLPLVVFRAIFGRIFTAAPEWFALVEIEVLQVMTIAIAIVALVVVSPRRLRWVAPLLFLPVAYLRGSEAFYYYADFPFRLILPMVMLGAIVFTVRSRGSRLWGAAVVGFLGGITALNNLDFGIPALIAGGLVIAFASRRVWISALIYCAAAVLAPVLYIAGGLAIGHRPHPSYFVFFIHSFGIDNFGNVDVPFFGVYIGFVMLGVVATIIGILGTRHIRSNRTAGLHQALLFSGAFLTLSLVYFSGRSLIPTLIGAEAIVAGVVLVLLVIAGVDQLPRIMRQRRSGSADAIVVVATGLAVAVALSSWTFFPPLDETALQFQIAPPAGSVAEDFLQPDPRVVPAAVLKDPALVGLLSVSGNIWSLKLGIPNALVFTNPSYLAFPGGADLECDFIANRPGRTLLTTQDNLVVLGASPRCRQVLDFATVKTLNVKPSVPLQTVPWQTIEKN